MAEKKTTQKVLSDKALELVMINVLGGLEGMMRNGKSATSQNEKSRVRERVKVDSLAEVAVCLEAKLNS